MRATSKGINKYCSHSGTVTNSREGTGSKVISVRFSHHTNKVLLLWDSNRNSMESDNNSSSSKRKKRLSMTMRIMRGMINNNKIYQI